MYCYGCMCCRVDEDNNHICENENSKFFNCDVDTIPLDEECDSEEPCPTYI